MEPVSVLGLVGTALSVAKAISQIISQLCELRSRYRNVPIHLLTLLNQLHVVRAALDQISSWSSKNLWSDPRYEELAQQIDTSLDCFGPLIFTLQQHLDKLKLPQDLDLSTKHKINFLWNEKDILRFLGLLDCQVNALNLFLQAVQCKTLAEQRMFVNDTHSRTILQKAKACNSSISGTSDASSIFSEYTNVDTVDHRQLDLRQFDIDAIHRYKPRRNGTTASGAKRIVADKQDTGQSLGTPTRAGQQETPRPTSVQVIRAIGIVLWWILFALWWLLWGVAAAVRFGLGSSHRTTSSEGGIPRQVKLCRPSSIEKRRILDVITTPATRRLLPAALFPTEVKLLLLGISDSGKSTLLEKMRLCTNGEHSFDKAASYTGKICSNISHGLRAVIHAMDHLGLPLEHRRNHQHVQRVMNKPAFWEEPRLPPHLGAALKELWADSGFQEAFNRRRECPLELRQIENLPYFASHVERLTADGYLPSPEDILRSRVLTTGIHETRLKVGVNVTARVFDVGGLRGERQKWSHYFNDVDCVVFTVDASAYSRFLPEDNTVSRMQEQLELWSNIVNDPRLINANFYLVFTKIDWLLEELQVSPVTDYFPDFEESGNGSLTKLLESYLEYLRRRFSALIGSQVGGFRTNVAYVDLVRYDGYNPAASLFHHAVSAKRHRAAKRIVTET